MYLYIYMYTWMCVCVCWFIFTYIYIYIYIEKNKVTVECQCRQLLAMVEFWHQGSVRKSHVPYRRDRGRDLPFWNFPGERGPVSPPWERHDLGSAKGVLYSQPTGPSPLYRRDDLVDRPCAMGVWILYSKKRYIYLPTMVRDFIPTSIYDRYSVGPSVRSICTRCCFTITDMIQVCSKFRRAPAFITNIRLEEISSHRVLKFIARCLCDAARFCGN